MGCRLLVLLVYIAFIHQSFGQRYVVKHDVAVGDEIANRAKALGLRLLRTSPAHGLTVLERTIQPSNDELHMVEAGYLANQIQAWPGVLIAEEDQPRYFQRPVAAHTPAVAALLARVAAETKSKQSSPYLDCTERDLPLSNSTLLPEYQPYGLQQIQASPSSNKLPNRTHEAGVLICIIDSGLDITHPDIKNNNIDGCKYQDDFAPAGCPFKFGQDFIGHGTHVAGTIAAQKNGQGVIGVIPGPAEIYVVRVFNDSGDVNQGQGLVYGSTLILAFTQCEGRLAAMQATNPAKNYRMVVSMSLGAAGPLSIEKLFFREALLRGDIIFVASSGNNGTAPTMVEGQLTSMINPGNYPGSYEEVISIAAVDCANQLAPFSQKNPTVDLAAPGVNILSAASRDYPALAGLMAGGFMSESAKIFISGGIASSANQVRYSGAGKFTGKVADCGAGSAACPAAKDSICLIQYDPQLKPADTGATQSSDNAGIMGSMFSQMAFETFGPNAALSGVSEQLDTPGKFWCDAMDFCMKAGAKAMLLGTPAISTGFYGSYDVDDIESFLNLPLIANLDCSDYNCTCWQRLKSNSNKLPTAGLSLQQYMAVKSAVANATKAGKALVGTVESREDAYLRLSGTSMAVPHASGAIARVWAAFPYCKAATVREAFEQTALDLGPKGKDVQFGYGLVQAESAYDYLARQPCAKGWQSAAFTQQAAATPKSRDTEVEDSYFKPLNASAGDDTSRRQDSAGAVVPAVAPSVSNAAGGNTTNGQLSKPVTVGVAQPPAAAAVVPGSTTVPPIDQPSAVMTPVVVSVISKSGTAVHDKDGDRQPVTVTPVMVGVVGKAAVPSGVQPSVKQPAQPSRPSAAVQSGTAVPAEDEEQEPVVTPVTVGVIRNSAVQAGAAAVQPGGAAVQSGTAAVPASNEDVMPVTVGVIRKPAGSAAVQPAVAKQSGAVATGQQSAVTPVASVMQEKPPMQPAVQSAVRPILRPVVQPVAPSAVQSAVQPAASTVRPVPLVATPVNSAPAQIATGSAAVPPPAAAALSTAATDWMPRSTKARGGQHRRQL